MRSSFDELPSLSRLLIVEDDPATRALFRTLFAEDLAADIVPTAPDALERMRAEEYDMALLDIHLAGSGSSGTDLMKQLRTMEGGQALPVVAVTAYARFDDHKELLAAGFDSYVAKPFTKDKLWEGMIRAIRRSGSPGNA